ncbi:HNH endonuclease [Stakelama marina]|uniref:TIGR02646 family protein n=1 Tax=Stakelama marina TaxID=2826939 RepID=A0A8T4IGN3_9SPHN|nr:hypothetical protein [Stakelama marina]MBR0553747.1 hypothetical protein [Stakelama marina]
MIRHTKSTEVPSSLGRGGQANEGNCTAYDAAAADYRSGARSFDIRKGIYGTDVVKRQLKADQHDKCAFCEAIFDANVAGDVEHYRPKGAVDTDAGRIYPGYYWLGYTWENLCYACPDCNSYRKRNWFPLEDEANRARDHHADLTLEQPLLLDAYGPRDPREHITFRGEAATGLTTAGEATIDILALGRTALARDRLQHLRRLTLVHESVSVFGDDPRPEAIAYLERARAELAAAILPGAKYSAATADHLAALDAGQNFLPASAS